MHLFLLQNESIPITSPNKFIPSNSSFSTGSSSGSAMSINEQQQITTNLKRSGSAVIRARFEPEVDGVNRYKHFHRPMLPSPSSGFHNHQHHLQLYKGKEDYYEDDGQSIDKTSPRRRSTSKRLSKLPMGTAAMTLNGVTNILPSIKGIKIGDKSNNNKRRQSQDRAKSSNGLETKGVEGLLPPISTAERRSSSFTALPVIENVAKQKFIEKPRRETSKSEKSGENMRGKCGRGNTALDEVTTVRVRRRIIISDCTKILQIS
uniref:Uncharacterized protein n=1 Tax=Meloidogyne hapla TaxID=6305 RepID=A0A1I8B0B3_MELHA